MNTEQQELIKKRQDSKMSSGELRVANFLLNRSIGFEREFFFDELKNPKTGNLLFFDFFIPEKRVCIEVDGIHHFKAVNGKEELQFQKYKDRLKNKFCNKNGMTLIRLSYKKNGKICLKKLEEFFKSRWDLVVVDKAVPIVSITPKKKKKSRKFKGKKFTKNDKYRAVRVEWDEEKGFVSPVISKVDDRIEKLRAERRALYPDDIKQKLGFI